MSVHCLPNRLQRQDSGPKGRPSTAQANGLVVIVGSVSPAVLAPGPKVFQARARSYMRCKPSQTVCGPGRPPRRARRDSVRLAKEIAAALPAEKWQPIKLREGAKGPVVYEYARLAEGSC